MTQATEPLHLPLPLRRRFHFLSARYNGWLLGLFVALLAIPIVVLLVLVADEPKLLDALAERLRQEVGLLIGLAGLAVLAVYLWCAVRHERLVVTSTGLEYRSPMRGPLAPLRPLKPDWRIAWDDLAAAAIEAGPVIPQKKVRRRLLVLKTRRGESRKIEPYLWYQKPDRVGLTFREWSKLGEDRYLRAVQGSPLVRVFEQRGLLAGDDVAGEVVAAKPPFADVPGGSFDLARNPGTMAVVIGLFGLAGYAVVDGFFVSPWRYVELPPLWPFGGAALAAAILAAMVTRAAPKFERWTLVAMIAVAAAAAVYPALLRVNAATDPDGATAYRYRQVGVGAFEPADDPELPRLAFTGGMEFWESLPPGGERSFRLARGAGEFWQLDLAAVRAEQRAFYRQE